MNLTPGSAFELFGGNVVGKVESAEAPKKLVQSWQARSPSWPSGESSLYYEMKRKELMYRPLRYLDDNIEPGFQLDRL
jgi:activator of HSP90 ATPase